MLATYARPAGTATSSASFAMPHDNGIEIHVCNDAFPSIKSAPLRPVISSEPAPPIRMSPAFHAHVAVGSSAGKPVISVQSAVASPLLAVPPSVVSDDPPRMSLSLPPESPSISWN